MSQVQHPAREYTLMTPRLMENDIQINTTVKHFSSLTVQGLIFKT